MEDKKQISTPMAIILAGFIIMIGIIINKTPTPKNEQVEDQVQNVSFSLDPVDKNENILGDLEKAEIIIVEYSDTECPFCKDFHNIMHRIYKKYDGKIAWVYRHFPLDNIHTKARTEAEASECAKKLGDNEKFWQYIDLIFENTKSNDSLDLALLPVFAENIGIDKKLFNECMQNKETVKSVQDDFESGIRAGTEGTPYSIIITKDGTQIPINGANEAKIIETIENILK